MIVSIIAAMDERCGIGKGGSLPWRLSADLQRFRQLTMGHHLIMGRLTYESIGRVLPGRVMIVVTRNPDFHAAGCLVAHSIEAALALAKTRGETEVFIIGGGEIFMQTMNLADRIYLTQVQADLDCDTFFPQFDQQDWQQLEYSFQPADDQNQYPSIYRLLTRSSKI